MKIGITGGAGYIGSTLVKNLVESGKEIVSIDNQMLGDYRYLNVFYSNKQVNFTIGDIRDGELLKDIFCECDSIAHLAALPGLDLCKEKPEEAISVNIYGTHQVMETARKLDIKKVVFCSSAAVYGNPVEIPINEEHRLRPLNLYGVTKQSGEGIMDTYWSNYGIETVNLRFGNVYGVGLFTRWDTVIPKFIRQALTEKPLTIYGDGEYSRDYVHVEDIVRAVILALEKPNIGGQSFNVGGETLTVNEIASIVQDVVPKSTGVKVQATFTTPRVGETKVFSYDTEKIEKVLGFKNQWSVEKSIQQIIDFTVNQLKTR